MADDILKTLIAEAYGEGPEGMRLVAETILNRAAIRGLTPEQVVQQKHQYTGLRSPGPDAKKAWNSPEAVAAAEAAWQLAQQPGDPTGGADHYYAPGTISQPWWAKSMTPKGEMGGHAFFASRPIPPGELPQVATALSTVPTPRVAPAPTTPSIDMAQMRRTRAPSQLIPDTFAGLSRPSRTLADDIALSPIPGGRQSAPMFDAAYDERTGQMRLTRAPIDSQGIAVGRSREPAPIPAMQSSQLAAIRNRNPVLQAELNRRNPARLPDVAPPMNASPVGRPPTTRVVRSVPVGGSDGVGSMPSFAQLGATLGRPLSQQEIPSLYADVFPKPLGGPSNVPANPNSRFSVATVDETVGPDGRRTTSPFIPAPTPFDRPDFAMGGRALPPIPMPRPSWMPGGFPTGQQIAAATGFRGGVPLVPLPIARPNVAPVRRAPIPMPLSMRPMAPVPRAPLRITVNGGNSHSESNSSSSNKVKGHSLSGGRRYDPDTAQWT